MTLNELIEEHPDLLDLPLATLQRDGNYDYLGGSYETHDYDEEGRFQVLVLMGNDL